MCAESRWKYDGILLSKISKVRLSIQFNIRNIDTTLSSSWSIEDDNLQIYKSYYEWNFTIYSIYIHHSID